jgi:hypothetical protein
MILRIRKIYILIILLTSGFTGLRAYRKPVELPLQWPQDYLSAHYDMTAGAQKLKKFELQLTPDGFFRLKKTFLSGKQEYFAFHLKKLDRFEYFGSVSGGTAYLSTLHDDIIVQTFNDRKGNIDTMARLLTIPLKDIGAEELDSVAMLLKKVKSN